MRVATLTISIFTVLFLPPLQGAELEFQRIALLDYEDGPPVVPSFEYQPGDNVWLSVRIMGFQRVVQDADAGLDRVQLSWQVRPQDASNTLLAPPMRGIIDETLRPEDKEWLPKFLVNFRVPDYAPRGSYKIAVTVRDDLAKKDLAGQVEFRVRGEPPVADSALGVRNFTFLANPDDRFGMQSPVYKPGSALLVRFDIIGYEFEGNNRFSVDYGVSILSPPNSEGVEKTMFNQEVAAEKSSESFYAQRWIPANFGINLDPDVPPGEYTLVVTLRDKVSEAIQEVRNKFEVKP